MAILFFVSTIVCILIWKTFAKKYSKANIEEANNTNDNNSDQSPATDENNGSCSGVFTYMYEIYYNVFDFNGKYYLWNLYTFECIEGLNQLNNLVNIYSCLLPCGWLVYVFSWALIVLSKATYKQTKYTRTSRFSNSHGYSN